MRMPMRRLITQMNTCICFFHMHVTFEKKKGRRTSSSNTLYGHEIPSTGHACLHLYTVLKKVYSDDHDKTALVFLSYKKKCFFSLSKMYKHFIKHFTFYETTSFYSLIENCSPSKSILHLSLLNEGDVVL